MFRIVWCMFFRWKVVLMRIFVLQHGDRFFSGRAPNVTQGFFVLWLLLYQLPFRKAFGGATLFVADSQRTGVQERESGAFPNPPPSGQKGMSAAA